MAVKSRIWSGEIAHAGTLIPLRVEHKRVKRLRLKVNRATAEVLVSAPLRISSSDVVRWVADHADWIASHRAPILQQLATQATWGDEEFCFLGERRSLQCRTATTGRTNVDLSSEPAILIARPNAEPAALRRVWVAALKAELYEHAMPQVERWAAVLEVPVPELRIREMRTRWGTCNATRRRVWLSLALVAHPPEALEYVIVHELAHLRVSSHGPEFYALLDVTLPGWREPHRQLKRATPQPYVPRRLA